MSHLPQLEVSTYASQIFWLVVVFLFFYIVSAKFISPVADAIFKNRRVNIDENVQSASEITEKTSELKQLYNTELQNILEIAEHVKKEALQTLDLAFAEKNLKFAEDLDRKHQKLFKEIKEDIDSFRNSSIEASISLASFIIEKITSQKPDQKVLKECYGKIKQ